MPTIVIDGIATRYEVIGSGPPLLMYAPGGFNATIEGWSTLGSYARIKLLPGHDAAHATSAARYLEECLPCSQYWDVAVEQQTEVPTNARILEFLTKVDA